ncbi:MAG: murein L,D-transpeptidase family protein, partial [Pseudoxanthomonas sp.]
VQTRGAARSSVNARDAKGAARNDRAADAARRVVPALEKDLGAAGLHLGDPVFVRIFKHEHQLELWMLHGRAYSLFRTYPICTWSGALGPKLRQGDGQSPEGFYSVGRNQLNPASQYHLAFNLGYPNAYDRALGRTGDFLMVHGKCVSIGCYAMGDAAIEEIYTLLDAALRAGQPQADVQVFPFRFDHPPTAGWRNGTSGEFWGDLESGYRAFERTHRPPEIRVLNHRYRVTPQGTDR